MTGPAELLHVLVANILALDLRGLTTEDGVRDMGERVHQGSWQLFATVLPPWV
jgi:hypothetical protein